MAIRVSIEKFADAFKSVLADARPALPEGQTASRMLLNLSWQSPISPVITGRW